MEGRLVEGRNRDVRRGVELQVGIEGGMHVEFWGGWLVSVGV